MSINHSARSGGIIAIYFQFSWWYVVFSLESSHRGDSKVSLNYLKSAAIGFFSRDSETSSKQP